MKQYVWEYSKWPKLTWDNIALHETLIEAIKKQHFLLGKVEGLGFEFKNQAKGFILEKEVLETAAIEGEKLDPEGVRSSIAEHLGLPSAGLRTADRKTSGLVKVLLDAADHHNKPLSDEKMKRWHAILFPDGYSDLYEIKTGDWRVGPMKIVSGPEGQHTVHYLAPPPEAVDKEMKVFLNWINDFKASSYTGITRAAFIHFWFVCIHPFDDGNGRIARALTDMALAQDEKEPSRFYSLSTQIMKEREDYYSALSSCSKGKGDITQWQEWFLGCYIRAIDNSQKLIDRILTKSKFWQEFAGIQFNERQAKVLNRLLDVGKGNFEGHLAARNYKSLTHTSKPTATRDLDDLIKKGVLKRLEGGGRSVKYDIFWKKIE